MKNLLIVLIIFITGVTSQLNAQYYDGKFDFTNYIGVSPGKDAFVHFGADLGVNNYISFGFSVQYLFKTDKELVSGPGLGYTLSLDLHGFHLFNMKKSDLIAGYNINNGASGVKIKYRKFLSEFFGFYGSTHYYFTPVPVSSFDSLPTDNQLQFQVGIVFKFVSGNDYQADF